MGTRLGIPVLVVLLAGVARSSPPRMLMVDRPDSVPLMAVPMEMPPTDEMPADGLLYAQAESGGETIALQNCPSLFFVSPPKQVYALDSRLRLKKARCGLIS